VRCPRCGNENPGTNRFCGMCGATLLPAPVPVTQGSTTASHPSSANPAPPTNAPTSPGPTSTASRTAVRSPEPQPVISGPSFLGLNQPAPSGGHGRGGLSIDPNAPPSSRSLDYLLEDEEPHRGGAGKYFLILVALLLAGGFGYLRWRHQPFPWQISGGHKPSASQPSDQQDSNTAAPAASPQNSPNTSTAPSSTESGTTAAQGTTSSAPGSGNSATNSPAGSTPSITPIPDTTTAANNPPATDTKQPVAKKPASQDADSDSSSDDSSEEDVPAAKPAKPKPEPTDVAPKPTAAARSAGTVAEAQKYLYGKGVRQDCSRGLRLLKPAADRADPKAMIEMGALYSAGLCTPRDLPTAYRWFAMALHKEPDNQSVQNDLQKLWGEMTQPERQLAIKLSQ
jgi:hypothetical protein